MADRRLDAIVLGGGPGGYACAIRLGQLGLSTACVEEEEYGGVCLNWGCIPSKALISNAHLYEKARRAGEVGIRCEGLDLDVAKMQDWKDGIVRRLTAGVRTLLRANGVEAVRGRGRLVAPTTVEVTGEDGGTSALHATRAVVVATGASPIEVGGFDLDGERILGARHAVSLRRIPRRLLVIGGGVIGLELGMAYRTFGSKLTVVELTPALLAGIDEDCVRVVERGLRKTGAAVHKSARAVGWEPSADGGVVVHVEADGGPKDIPCDAVLVAVGMRPRSRGIGLEDSGIAIDERGFVSTDDGCRTSVPGVYAIGDVSGPPMLAHKATKEGEVCAEVVAGRPAGKDWATVPGIVFTDPEIATVGLTEEQARAEGLRVAVGRFPFAALGRALSLRETDGFVKVVRDEEHHRIVGVHVVGPSASDLVSEAALALEMVATADDVAMTIHPHPTLGEALMEASAASLGRAIHVVNR